MAKLAPIEALKNKEISATPTNILIGLKETIAQDWKEELKKDNLDIQDFKNCWKRRILNYVPSGVRVSILNNFDSLLILQSNDTCFFFT